MATQAQKAAYMQAILPHANSAAAKLGAPSYGPLIWAWWSWETDFGTNGSSKVYNHAGIKKNSSGRDFESGQYAGYNSMGNFVNDWVRILSLGSYGYPAVVAAMKNGKSFGEVTQLHNASSWSEADYNVQTILDRAAAAGGQSGGSAPSTPVNLPDVSNMSQDDLKKYAAVGLAVAAALFVVLPPSR